MGSSQVQGEIWGSEAQDWAELFEPMSRPVWVAMLDSATVNRGTKFLDLGCGGGGSSVLASERGAQVAGLDAAETLINIARKRIPHGDFRVGDFEVLPYEDNSFDVTFASMSVMFANNPSEVFREMERVTNSEGRVTVGIWGRPEDCDYRHILKAMANTLPTSPHSKGPFSLSEAGQLEGIMETAGLMILDSGEVDAPFLFPNFEKMWRVVSSAGPMQAAKQLVSERELKAAIVQAAKPFRTDKGEILMNNRLRFVTAMA